jgi:hypothetical protein
MISFQRGQHSAFVLFLSATTCRSGQPGFNGKQARVFTLSPPGFTLRNRPYLTGLCGIKPHTKPFRPDKFQYSCRAGLGSNNFFANGL